MGNKTVFKCIKEVKKEHCRLTKGKDYTVEKEDDMFYGILDDKGQLNRFTKEEDYDGMSYRTFFKMVN